MTSLTNGTSYNQERTNHRLQIIFICVLMISLSAVLLTPHAWERHGQDAWNAVQCLNQNGPVMQLENRKTNRVANICTDNPDAPTKWYVVIVCTITGALITAFRRERARRRIEVESYLRASGFDKPV